MIASTIAYCMTAFFLLLSINGFSMVARDKEPAGQTNAFVIGSFICLFAAYGCARLGGI